MTIFEDGVPPEFRIFFFDPKMRRVKIPAAEGVSIQTIRPDGTCQTFPLYRSDCRLVSADSIPEPHEFTAVLSVSHDGRIHEHELSFVEHVHAHAHSHADGHALDHTHAHAQEAGDAHARAHARQTAKRVGDQPVSSAQVVAFGLSSGMTPCPATLTTLLVCLRMKKVVAGLALVSAFSLGLAIMLIAIRVAAAIGAAHASRRLPAFGRATAVLPYLSTAFVVGLGAFMTLSGYTHLP